MFYLFIPMVNHEEDTALKWNAVSNYTAVQKDTACCREGRACWELGRGRALACLWGLPHTYCCYGGMDLARHTCPAERKIHCADCDRGIKHQPGIEPSLLLRGSCYWSVNCSSHHCAWLVSFRCIVNKERTQLLLPGWMKWNWAIKMDFWLGFFFFLLVRISTWTRSRFFFYVKLNLKYLGTRSVRFCSPSEITQWLLVFNMTEIWACVSPGVKAVSLVCICPYWCLHCPSELLQKLKVKEAGQVWWEQTRGDIQRRQEGRKGCQEVSWISGRPVEFHLFLFKRGRISRQPRVRKQYSVFFLGIAFYSAQLEPYHAMQNKMSSFSSVFYGAFRAFINSAEIKKEMPSPRTPRHSQEL